MTKEHWQDWGTALTGAWVFVSPWFIGFHAAAGVSALVTGNFVAVGAVLIFLGVWEPRSPARAKEWVIALVGGWLFISPWVLDYVGSEVLAWNGHVAGLAALAYAGWAIGDMHELLPKLNRPQNDLRGDQLGLSLPDEHEHLAGQAEHRPDAGPGVLTPGIGHGSPGQATKSS